MARASAAVTIGGKPRLADGGLVSGAMWGGQSCLRAGVLAGLSNSYQQPHKPADKRACRQECPPHVEPGYFHGINRRRAASGSGGPSPSEGNQGFAVGIRCGAASPGGEPAFGPACLRSFGNPDKPARQQACRQDCPPHIDFRPAFLNATGAGRDRDESRPGTMNRAPHRCW